eukprot:CAMPEP_0198734878 /NCGR_PEP_ID=MMETSP1475-20131203/55733_1 /TAXON_ID= ORGANISM="Unidentified sp., Strain CCMP1999" /NCGR_SAMPLE_ID=MMETSP1475 /ASSEMBLY_ACC=CAM_ASM_001111 /LENGTH=41 /DNA_ID= /DNA_START= /DNA_END= /DNA_ORIENTATION=
MTARPWSKPTKRSTALSSQLGVATLLASTDGRVVTGNTSCD